MGFSKRRAKSTDATDPERGANLVEFAVLAPLLILLIIGIVEFGWLFGQFNDVRHGAREGARFASVDGGPGTNATDSDIADRVCNAMDGLDGGMTNIEVTLALTDTNGTSGIQVGDTGTITVVGTSDSLSGLPPFSSLFPFDLTSSVEFRLEQDPTWDGSTTPINLTSCP